MKKARRSGPLLNGKDKNTNRSGARVFPKHTPWNRLRRATSVVPPPGGSHAVAQGGAILGGYCFTAST